MMPDIAAMITAMTVVTTATPPRVRPIEILSALYMSLAMPDRSRNDAITMKKGTAIIACVTTRS